jgi:hypothetical protein
MKLRWLSAALFCATLSAATNDSRTACFAQGVKTKPDAAKTAVADTEDTSVVVVAVNSLDTLIPNIQHLARTTGFGAVAGTVSTMVNQYSAGLDRTRPIGVFMDLDEAGQPAPVGCLPISDLTAFFDQLSVFGEANDLGGGLYEFSLGSPIYAKKMGDWLYVAQSEDALEDVAANKALGLVKMVKSYDIRVQLNPQNIPDEMIDFLVGQMQAGLEQGMAAQRENMDAEEAAATQAASEQMIEQIQEGIEGTERIVLGIAVKKAEKKTIIDVGSQFVADSKFAKQMEKAKASKTAFSGIPQDASMMTLQTLQLVEAEDLAQLEKTLDASLKTAFNSIDEKSDDPQSAAKVKEFISKAVDILIESAKQGKLDSAVDVNVESGLNIVASIAVAEGAKVEMLASEIAKEVSKDKGPFQLQIGTGKHAGANLHKATLKLPPEADAAARKIFGDSVNIAIGTTPKAVHLAIGKTCDASLKSALDRSASKPSGQAEMVKMRFALTQLLNYIQTIESTPISEAMLSASSAGNDRVMIDTTPIDRGAVFTLSLEDGVVKAIAAGVRAGQNAGGGF